MKKIPFVSLIFHMDSLSSFGMVEYDITGNQHQKDCEYGQILGVSCYILQ